MQEMKTAMLLYLVFSLAIIKLGSAFSCYNCNDDKGVCTETETCSGSCLTLKEKGGKIYRQCIKTSECNTNQLSQRFDNSFTYDCCNTDLCNGATTIGKPLVVLLASMAALWWCL